MVNLLDLYEVQGALCPFWNYFLLSFFQVNETMRAQNSTWNIFRKLHLGPKNVKCWYEFPVTVHSVVGEQFAGTKQRHQNIGVLSLCWNQKEQAKAVTYNDRPKMKRDTWQKSIPFLENITALAKILLTKPNQAQQKHWQKPIWTCTILYCSSIFGIFSKPRKAGVRIKWGLGVSFLFDFVLRFLKISQILVKEGTEKLLATHPPSLCSSRKHLKRIFAAVLLVKDRDQQCITGCEF